LGVLGAAHARAGTSADVEQLYGIWAAIRGGATTIVDIGSRNAVAEWGWNGASMDEIAPISCSVASEH
jgi:hypothetical protein